MTCGECSSQVQIIIETSRGNRRGRGRLLLEEHICVCQSVFDNMYMENIVNVVNLEGGNLNS
ncbi:hypothetical protein E2C01_068149 [Portunus trituberculatus]|uniref:Uncharacterized protein n=1 Tax=Portunus trituberculatus TaxID=210409 RepID=A0A5B7HLP6_PORTR|nr:hypothetical protein [Portunus trituberculatus]